MERKVLLEKLLNMEEPNEVISSGLSHFPWDSDELVTLNREHVANVLRKYINSKISSIDIEHWANIIECREDIGREKFYGKVLNDVIFKLANPDVVGDLTKEKARKLEFFLLTVKPECSK